MWMLTDDGDHELGGWAPASVCPELEMWPHEPSSEFSYYMPRVFVETYAVDADGERHERFRAVVRFDPP